MARHTYTTKEPLAIQTGGSRELEGLPVRILSIFAMRYCSSSHRLTPSKSLHPWDQTNRDGCLPLFYFLSSHSEYQQNG
jgi:hypothetical protein